ncbi:MAG TPA: DegT/DnrJ/EryC1/StrS family aminotransferase [Thermodesulfovibrionales bacterium]|nr:DegT/DnrJ/EryC1/StrS family aminotransferase [Thermodesulfovibrionales bacterium]
MIPVNEPSIGDKELEYVIEAVKSGWISSEGKYIKAFEEKFSGHVRRRHGIAVNNGTNALILALRALDMPAACEVILPSFTIISCAMACVYNGLVPVFCDSVKDTWNIDTSKIEEKITERTKAIMPVHIYGHPVDMDGILEIAKRHNLYVIEDFAEAIGSEYKGQRCGSFGDISCASFYANKVITTGEGGMCLTDDAVLAEKLRRLRNLAFIPEERFVHYELGFNFRMTNIQAAIGLAQTERIDDHVKTKVRLGESYNGLLRPLQEKGLIELPVEREWARNTYWMYGIVLNPGLGLSAVKAMGEMADKGVQTRPFFYPMHLQPVFRKYPWFKKELLPVSEFLYKYGFYLPSGLTLTEGQISEVAERVKEVVT